MKQDFQTFFQTNQGRIHYQIQRLGITGDLYEDFYSEGMIALWKAYKSFEPTKGNLGTYLNFRIRYRLIDLLRKRARENEQIEQIIRDKITEIDGGHRYGLSKFPLVNQQGLPVSNEPFWHEVKRHLSKRQWQWVEYFIIADLTIQEIAEIESVSADAVKSWGREARRKLRKKEVIQRLKTLYSTKNPENSV